MPPSIQKEHLQEFQAIYHINIQGFKQEDEMKQVDSKEFESV